MKKHFKFLSNSILATVAISSTAISCGLVLSSCTNTNNNNNGNDDSTSNDIKIEDQSADNHEVTSGIALTLYVNVKSTKPVKYQWFVDKNNNNGWTKITDATESSYSITSDSTQNITSDTTWKYKVEIYDADDANIKLTSNTYSVNIKPQSTSPEPNPSPNPNPNPGPNPEPSPTPPTNPDNNPSTGINSSSITLKNIGQLLPSQYLSNLTNIALDKTLIIEGFDTNKITNVSYSASELDDRTGTLKILMNYTENNANKSYPFTFTNLLQLENSGYHLEFINATEILNLSAQNIANKSLNSKSAFESLLNELKNSNIKFKFKNKGNELPLNYLDFNSINITGFDTSWFTSNKKIVLSFNFQSPKINYFVKTASGNITSSSFNYPTNISKEATMEFYSATDYLLNQITNNSEYKSDKYAAYYYYDIINNGALESQVKISNTFWLSNVTTQLNYDGKNYTFKPVLNNETSSSNGSLTINLSMEYQDNGSYNVKSQKTKDVTITGFIEYNQNNLFSNSDDVNDKFSLSCGVENYDKNIERLKSRKDSIIKEIDAMGESETSISFVGKIPNQIIENLKNSLSCKFSGIELTNNTNKNYYHNELTAINGFYINPSETYLRYNKTNDVFQLVINNFTILGVGVGNDDQAINTSSMIINITHPGKSLANLRNS